jgi:hypothetical protein
MPDLVECGGEDDRDDYGEDQPGVVDDLARAARDAVHQIQPHMAGKRRQQEHCDDRREEEDGERLHDRVGDLGRDQRHLEIHGERATQRARTLGRRRGVALSVENETERDELLQQPARVVGCVGTAHLFGQALRDVLYRLAPVDLLEGAVEELRDLDERAVTLGKPLLLRVTRVLQLAREVHVRRETRRVADLGIRLAVRRRLPVRRRLTVRTRLTSRGRPVGRCRLLLAGLLRRRGADP